MGNTAILAKTLLKMSDMAGSPTFTTVAEVRDIQGPGYKRKVNDVTSQDDTNKQILPSSVLDSGDVIFTIGYVPASATHGGTTGLLKNLNNNTKVNFKLMYVNSTEQDFAAYVTGFKPDSKVEGDLTAQVTLSISDTLSLP